MNAARAKPKGSATATTIRVQADDELARAAVREVGRKIGYRPSHRDLQGHGFGGIGQKLSAAEIKDIASDLDLPDRPTIRKWTREECEKKIVKLWGELDRRPTHGELRSAGLHRLAQLYSIAEISEIGKRYNLNDNNSRRYPGHWTKIKVVEHYLFLFESRKLLPGPSDLRNGGHRSLATTIHRVFGKFSNFQAEVMIVASNAKFRERPIADDGTSFDSFRELAAYEGIIKRLDFQQEEVIVHARIASGKRNCVPDFIVGNVAIEVLMYADEKDAEACGAGHYFINIKEKELIYEELNLTPFRIRPQDVTDPALREQCVDNLGRILGFRSRELPFLGRGMREHGYWSRQMVKQEVRELAAKLGRFPSFRELDFYNIGSAKNPVKKYPRELLAKELGYELKKSSNGIWTEEKIIDELRLISVGDEFPARAVLEDNTRLIAAIKKSGKGIAYYRDLFARPTIAQVQASSMSSNGARRHKDLAKDDGI